MYVLTFFHNKSYACALVLHLCHEFIMDAHKMQMGRVTSREALSNNGFMYSIRKWRSILCLLDRSSVILSD